MFGRLLWRLVVGSRGRLVMALLAVTGGAAVISGLLNLDFDIEHKLAQEFRLLGPNLVIAREGEGQPQGEGASPALLMDESAVTRALNAMSTSDLAGAAPYLYIVGRVADTPVVVAGTEIKEARALNPTWKIEGSPAEGQCLVGRNVARQFNLAPSSSLQLSYMGRTTNLTVGAVLDSGGAEDDQLFAALPSVQSLAGMPGQIELEQLRVKGQPKAIAAFADALQDSLPAYTVRPIPQATAAEGNLLHRTKLLIVSMVLLILTLTTLCVLATMSALALERRIDVGLMKALGGSIGRIMALFFAEASVVGAAGGCAGSLIGILLARWMGERVFHAAIAPNWKVYPMTIGLMVVAAVLGALPLRLLGSVKPAFILRGE